MEAVKNIILGDDIKRKPEDLPVWNFDGSSTRQAPGDNSDVLSIY